MTAIESKAITAQLSFDFSQPARTNNVIQLADRRKAPVEDSFASEIREIFRLESNASDRATADANAAALFDCISGAMDAYSTARREGGDGSLAAREYFAQRKNGRA